MLQSLSLPERVSVGMEATMLGKIFRTMPNRLDWPVGSCEPADGLDEFGEVRVQKDAVASEDEDAALDLIEGNGFIFGHSHDYNKSRRRARPGVGN
jgi:hypothetical protein